MHLETEVDHSEHARVQFLDNEIDLSHTFLDLAEIEKEDCAAATHARAAARKGYTTALACMNHIHRTEDWHRLMVKLFRLKARLDGRSG